MTIKDFFNEPKFKRFQNKYSNNLNIEELYNYLENEETVKIMIDATRYDSPPLSKIVNEIEEQYASKIDLENNDSLTKQLIGSMISYVMAQYGYKSIDKSKSIKNNSKYFSVAACFENVKKNIFDETKPLKTISSLQNFGTDETWLNVKVYYESNHHDKKWLTFEKLLKLLLNEETVKKIIENIEKGNAPIDYVFELIDHEELECNDTEYLFNTIQGHIILESILEEVLKQHNYYRSGVSSASKYFHKTLKYKKFSTTTKKHNTIIDIPENSCYVCKKIIENEQAYLMVNVILEDNHFINENIRINKPKICQLCCSKIKPLNDFFNTIDLEQLKKDCQFLRDLTYINGFDDAEEEFFSESAKADEIITDIKNGALINAPDELIVKYQKQLESYRKEIFDNINLLKKEKNENTTKRENDQLSKFCFYLGLINKKQGNYVQALNDFEESFKYIKKNNQKIDWSYIDLKFETSSIVKNEIGLILEILGKYDEAIKQFTEAIDINPERPEYYKNRGIIYQRLENFEKAQEDFKKFKKLKKL